MARSLVSRSILSTLLPALATDTCDRGPPPCERLSAGSLGDRNQSSYGFPSCHRGNARTSNSLLLPYDIGGAVCSPYNRYGGNLGDVFSDSRQIGASLRPMVAGTAKLFEIGVHGVYFYAGALAPLPFVDSLYLETHPEKYIASVAAYLESAFPGVRCSPTRGIRLAAGCASEANARYGPSEGDHERPRGFEHQIRAGSGETGTTVGRRRSPSCHGGLERCSESVRQEIDGDGTARFPRRLGDGAASRSNVAVLQSKWNRFTCPSILCPPIVCWAPRKAGYSCPSPSILMRRTEC